MQQQAKGRSGCRSAGQMSEGRSNAHPFSVFLKYSSRWTWRAALVEVLLRPKCVGLPGVLFFVSLSYLDRNINNIYKTPLSKILFVATF